MWYEARGEPDEMIQAMQSPGKHPVEVRDALDAAVRRLALSTADLQERADLAAAILRVDLNPADFVEREDRTLFEQVMRRAATLTDVVSIGRVEELAEDIVDLRDAYIGRSLRHARLERDEHLGRGR